MKITEEILKFNVIKYPQLTRLPGGIRFVKQDGYGIIKDLKN